MPSTWETLGLIPSTTEKNRNALSSSCCCHSYSLVLFSSLHCGVLGRRCPEIFSRLVRHTCGLPGLTCSMCSSSSESSRECVWGEGPQPGHHMFEVDCKTVEIRSSHWQTGGSWTVPGQAGRPLLPSPVLDSENHLVVVRL